MGEPAGIGGEITLMAWLAAKAGALPVFAVIDDAARLKAAAEALGLAVPVQVITRASEAAAAFRIGLPVLHRPLKAVPVPGKPDPKNAQAVIAAIDEAADLVLSGGASMRRAFQHRGIRNIWPGAPDRRSRSCCSPFRGCGSSR
jgi:4-hydroxythreonine-4-phosphate dehydrogenase